jgi:hypothetical protein
MTKTIKTKELITKFSDSANPKVHSLICVDEIMRSILAISERNDERAMSYINFLMEVKEEIVDYEFTPNYFTGRN